VTYAQQLAQVARVKDIALKQPDALDAARRAHGEARKALKAATAELKDREAEIASLVAGDRDLKNVEARKAATAARLRDDAEIRRLTRAVDDAEAVVMNAEMDVRRREDEQRAWRTYLDALVAEVQLLTAGR
jgi:predicted  nucleic acid-binding Zn-ribbon protein